ncbi:hypothetical protein ABIQ69_11315 [Agromyces sp. G08B096]|uniref:DUF7666 domain-containing protein n=1 Tax=Agromyces sp. G08B096 TaxID=3156399 RepID=A0AAU7W437_9MICO
MPLDVLKYYPPAKSVYHQVELEDVDTDTDDSKVAARKITIGAKLDPTGLIKAQVDFVFKNAKPVEGATSKRMNTAVKAEVANGAATASGYSGAATASGYSGAATASGDYGAATASGDKSVATATGYDGRARGIVGTALLLVERDAEWNIVGAAGVLVDGKKIKADTWYRLHGGKVVTA